MPARPRPALASTLGALALASTLGALALGLVAAMAQRDRRAPSAGAADDQRATASPASAPLSSTLASGPAGAGAPFDVGPGVSSRSGSFEGGSGRRFAWRTLRVDLSSAALAAVPVPGARLERLAADGSLRFAVNAGFFEPSLEPSGLLVSRGRRLAALAPRGGSGVLWVAGGRARVLPSAGPLPAFAGADLALQCGPRLVEGGRPGVRRDDGRRAARTAICVREGGRSLDVVLVWDPNRPGEGPGLFRLAELLADPSLTGDPSGCEDALNLDGGPSTGLAFRGMPEGWAPRAPGPVPWALAVTSPPPGPQGGADAP